MCYPGNTNIAGIYGKTTPQQNNPLGWGGPQMRWGSTDPGTNMGYASQNMPGATMPNQQSAAGLYGTPWSSNPNNYGRWNWINATQGSQVGGQQGQTPYTPPGTPPPTTQPPPPTGGAPGTTPPPPAGTPPGTTPPTGGMPNGPFGGGVGTQPGTQQPPSNYNGMFGLSDQQVASTQRNPGVPSQGDIWSNAAFANAAANSGGGGLFGGSPQQPVIPGGQHGARLGNGPNIRGQGPQQAAQGGLMSPAWWAAVQGQQGG